MRLRWIVALLVLSTLVAGLLLAPVPHLLHWFMPANPPVVVSGAHGIVPLGSAHSLQVRNRVLARNVRWRLRPQDVLLLKAGWRLDFGGPARGEGVLRVGITGNPQVADTRLRAELGDILNALGYASLPVNGKLALDIARLEIDAEQGQVRAAEGEARLLGLAWAMGDKPLRLGDFRAVLTTDEGGVLQAEVTSLPDSPIEAAGTASLQPSGRWQADLRIRARDDAPDSTRNLLKLIGRADNEGYHRLRQSGQWRR